MCSGAAWESGTELLLLASAENVPRLREIVAPIDGFACLHVSIKQSQRLHEALRAAGVDSELILYPNVDHGFAKPNGGPDDAVHE